VTAPTPGLDVAALRRLVDEMGRLVRGNRWAALGLSFAQQGPAIVAALEERERLRRALEAAASERCAFLRHIDEAPCGFCGSCFARSALAAREAEEVERG
jgi:hypothetical protein